MSNPYQSPPFSRLPVVPPYIPIGPIAYLFIGIVVFQLVLAMASIGASVLNLDFLQKASNGIATQQEADIVDFSVAAVALLRMLVFFVAIVFYLIWFYRAYRNLPALRAVEVYTSPGGAVGFHFIPCANLYFVYRGMREIWLGSHPKDLHAIKSPMIKHLVGAPIVGFWWGLHLVSGFLAPVAVRFIEMGERQQNISMLQNAVLIDILSDLLHMAAGLLLVCIVYFSTLHQEERFELDQKLSASR